MTEMTIKRIELEKEVEKLEKEIEAAKGTPSTIQKVNTVTPMAPVLTQMNTYSESGGMSDNFLNLLLAGMSLDNIPKPIPHGASFIYFAMAALLMSRTFADASSFALNADLILRICWLLLPIVVNMSINKRIPPTIAHGTKILIDLAKNK